MKRRASERIKENIKGVVDDEMLKKQTLMYLAYLERDIETKNIPFTNEKLNVMKLDDNIETLSKKRKQRKTITKKESFKLRVRRTFPALIEQAKQENGNEQIKYLAIVAPESIYLKRKFCSVCGFLSCYKCTICYSNYCSKTCGETHQSTRCNKWVV